MFLHESIPNPPLQINCIQIRKGCILSSNVLLVSISAHKRIPYIYVCIILSFLPWNSVEFLFESSVS